MSETFKSLYEQHAKPLWAYVARLTGDPSFADDVVQEAFIRFLNKAPSLSPAQQKAYLYKTATNLVYDVWRKQRKQIAWDEAAHDPAAEIIPGAKIDFEKAFQQLSPQQRALLWMAYAENYPHDEIANILKLKPKSIKVLLFRAKNHLIKILNELGITEI